MEGLGGMCVLAQSTGVSHGGPKQLVVVKTVMNTVCGLHVQSRCHRCVAIKAMYGTCYMTGCSLGEDTHSSRLEQLLQLGPNR